MPTGRRQSYPISDADLDKWKSQAEGILSKIKGNIDIEEVFRKLSPEEVYRTLPAELELVYKIRHSTCLFYHFVDRLMEDTGQRRKAAEAKSNGIATTPELQRVARFISAYALFVMASSIVSHCEKKLRSKDQSKLAQLGTDNFQLECGRGFANDLSYALGYYTDAVQNITNNGNLVQNGDDLLAVTKTYWTAVAKKATQLAKEAAPEHVATLEQTTFRYNSFVITGLTCEDRKDEKVIVWSPVKPEEVVGDPDVTIILRRQCDRIALYDPVLRRNPICEFGGLLESILIDGPPGTGKTTRQRMMMTVLAMRAEQIGVSYMFKSVSADQIKSEWYGKTAQLVAQMLTEMRDPSLLSLLFFDDIDLLMGGSRDDPSTSNADRDIMKSLMDFFAGNTTVYAGNYVSVAATNKPTGIDDALRQRFVYRAIIQGAQTKEDYVDLAFNELRPFAKTGLLAIKPGRYTPLSRKLPAQLAETYTPELRRKYSKTDGTWDEIGEMCSELRQKDPKFTGRSVRNAIQAAIAKAADFEIPAEWFTSPEIFRAKSWEERLEMLKGLYSKLTAGGIMLAIEYQFEVERRYERESTDKRVTTEAEAIRIHAQALEMAKKQK